MKTIRIPKYIYDTIKNNYQKGGTVGKILTGNFIEGQEDHPNPNAELERGEYVQTPDGSSMEVMGKKHSEGGELMDLPDNTKVVSDYLKIGSKLATYFKQEYGLNTVASNTFATVLDKYKKKIGLTQLIEDEEKLMNKLNDQEDVEFEGTRDINLQVLSEKIYELQPQKDELEDRFNTFTNLVFDKQEQTKDGKDEFKKQEGGDINSDNPVDTTDQNGQPIPQQNEGDDIEQIVTMYSQMTGVDPRELIQQLQQLDDRSLEEAINQMVQAIQQSQEGSEIQSSQEQPTEGQPVMQRGGQVTETTSPLNFLSMLGIAVPKTDDESLRNKYKDYDLYNLNKIINTPTSQNTPQATLNRIKIAQELYDNKFGGAGNRKAYMDLNYKKDLEDEYYGNYAKLDDTQLQNRFRDYSKSVGRIHEMNALGRLMDERHINPVKSTWNQIPSNIQKPTNSNSTLAYRKEGGGIDEGYYNNNAPIDPFEYLAQRIRQGKSVLGGLEKPDEILDPGSEQSATDVLTRAATLAQYNPAYKESYTKLVTALNNAKTSKERFNVLNTYGQKERQNAFRNSFNDEISGYVGMGYAPTETQLLKTYQNLTGDSKKEFENLLKKDGITIKNNKVVIPGGFYKNSANYNQDSNLYKFYDALKTTNPTVYNKLGIDNITDGVWDRRAETIHSAEFGSIKDRDAYAEKQGFKSFTNTNGDLVWVDPNNRNNLIIPKVYRDKKVSNEDFKKYQENTNASDKEGYKNFGDRNVYERWVTDNGEVSSDPNQSVDKNNGINPMGNLDREWDMGLPMLTPDQSNLPPTYLATTLRQVGHVQANPIKISPEETIKELNRQYNVASELSSETNPYTSGAAQANLQAQTNSAINQAYSQAAIANAQDERNVDNINEDRIQQRDNTNIGMMDRYEKEQISGLDNYVKEWRSYIDKNNLENVNNWNLENQRQAFNAVNDNYKIGSMGWYQTQEQPHIQYSELPSGELLAYNTKTKQSQIVSKTNPDGTKVVNKTETTTPKKKKGGLLLSNEIKNWLK